MEKKDNDIWSTFEFNPNSMLLTIVPVQKYILVYNLINKNTYLNRNPYGEAEYNLVNNINTSEFKSILSIQNNVTIKNISITLKNELSKILVKGIQDFQKDQLSFKETDKDQIQISFLNNALYRLEIRKIIDNRVVHNLIVQYKKNDLYVLFKNLELKVNKIECTNNNVIIYTKVQQFHYNLTLQESIVSFLSLLLQNSENKENKQLSENDINLSIVKNENLIEKQISNLYYNEYYKLLYFSVNKIFFILNTESHYIYSNLLNLSEPMVITSIEYAKNEIKIYFLDEFVSFCLNNNINNTIFHFLNTYNNFNFSSTFNLYHNIDFSSINGSLNRLEIQSIDDNTLEVKYISFYPNKEHVTVQGNMLKFKDDLIRLEFLSKSIIIETNSEMIKFPLTIPSDLFVLMREITLESI